MKIFLLSLSILLTYAHSLVYAQAIDPDLAGKNDRFEQYMGKVIGPKLQNNIDLIGYEGQNDGRSILEFTIDFLKNRVMPILLVLSLVLVAVGSISMMISSDDQGTKTATSYIVGGIVGITLLLSISYIMGVLVGGDGGTASNTDSDGILEQFGRSLGFTDIYYEYDDTKGGSRLVMQIYDRLIYPFIKFISYLLVGILFVVLLINVFKYLSEGGEEGMQAKTLAICVNAIVGILLIAGAKFIVQFVYGVQQKVLKQNITNLSQLGGPIAGLDESSVSNTQLIFNYLNRGLSFLAFVIVILIILNAYKLLFAGDNAEALEKTKKYFLYLALGLLIVGFAYMIVNVVIVK